MRERCHKLPFCSLNCAMFMSRESSALKVLDKKNDLPTNPSQFARCLMRVLSWISTFADIASI